MAVPCRMREEDSGYHDDVIQSGKSNRDVWQGTEGRSTVPFSAYPAPSMWSVLILDLNSTIQEGCHISFPSPYNDLYPEN